MLNNEKPNKINKLKLMAIKLYYLRIINIIQCGSQHTQNILISDRKSFAQAWFRSVILMCDFHKRKKN